MEHHQLLQKQGVKVDANIDLNIYSRALCVFQQHFISSYKYGNKFLSRLPLSPESRCYWKGLGRRLPPDSASLISLERSAYLAHGLRIVNSAFKKPWLCLDPGCILVTGQHTEFKQDCKLVQKMVLRGQWFLRRACRSDKEFCTESNRMKIREAQGWDSHGLGRPWLPRLFARWDHRY